MVLYIRELFITTFCTYSFVTPGCIEHFSLNFVQVLDSSHNTLLFCSTSFANTPTAQTSYVLQYITQGVHWMINGTENWILPLALHTLLFTPTK